MSIDEHELLFTKPEHQEDRNICRAAETENILLPPQRPFHHLSNTLHLSACSNKSVQSTQ